MDSAMMLVTLSAVVSLLSLLVAFYSWSLSRTAIAEANDPTKLVQLRELVVEYDRALTEHFQKNQAQWARQRKRDQAAGVAPQPEPVEESAPGAVNGAAPAQGHPSKAALRLAARERGLM